MRMSDVDAATLTAVRLAVDRLCGEYPCRPAEQLIVDGRQWLRRVADLRGHRLTLAQHREVLTLAGWLALLVGCAEYDLGDRTAAEGTRNAALTLGQEADSPELVGWASTDLDCLVEMMKRRSVLQLATKLTAGGALASSSGAVAVAGALVPIEQLWSEPGRMHSALDRGSVSPARLSALRHDAAELGVRVTQVPAATLMDETLAQFRDVRRLVDEKQPLAAQRELTICGAMFALVLGEILFCEGHWRLAAHWYEVARRSAEEATDQYFADIALAGSALLPMYTPDPRAVVATVTPRLESRHAPSPAIAWLWAFQAKAHAMLGDSDTFQRSIDRARQALDHSSPELIHPGHFSFVPAQLAFYEARGWVELNNADDASAAADRALSLYDPNETTDPALVRFEQASAYAQAGELTEACRIATTAVLDPRTYHCAPVTTRAHEFDRLLGPSDCEPVRDWRETLMSLRKPHLALTAEQDEAV
jgi:hypothetical protein